MTARATGCRSRCASPVAMSWRRIWKARVGRVSVYLLDTNCQENASEDREITHRLYGGDASVRIRQEMILGLGGVRALRALGHGAGGMAHERGPRRVPDPRAGARGDRGAAWISPPRSRRRPPSACSRPTRRSPPATTPSIWAVHRIASRTSSRARGVRWSACSIWGARRMHPQAFNMTHLALNGARRVNGVSRIHGAVSSRLCADHWPRDAAESRIRSAT